MNKTENPGADHQGENLDKGFTVKEVASFIDETPNVIRNWFKELRDYIPHEKNSNGYNVYKKEGIERFKEIQALHRQQNWSMKQIEHYFATGGESFKPEPEKTAGEMIAEELRLLREEVKALKLDNQDIKDQLDKQEAFNQALALQLKERDKQLVQSLRESMENQKLLAAAKEEKEEAEQKEAETKKGFFARLFGR